MQKTFNVLPTDPRFLDLTEEQLDLIYEHMSIDIELRGKRNSDTSARDNDYNEMEEEHEQYDDPDFNDVWNNDEEYEKQLQQHNDFIGENESFPESDANAWEEDLPETDIGDDWEEVE